jgi:ATP-dependent helicase/nuclease subunit A
MIDEFQDNNSLQRDLIFFLAEKPERDSPELPEPGELVPGKVFFVGDEKQSIFRFRGADVSVFRRLTRDLGGGLNLSRNYRSHPGLVRAFNRIFGGLRSKDDPAPSPGIFPPPEKERAPYEASYSWTESPEPEGGPGQGPGGERLHFALLDEDQIGEGNFPGPEELEAAFIACKIRDMIKRGSAVYDKQRKENRPCTYGDFAVLQRSYSRQYVLEKQLKLFGIPFNANRPSGLFNEAPVNDLRALLTLVVYPEDRIAYGALLRSPFVRLSDDAFGLCMLAAEAPPSGLRTPQGPGAPFDERTGELLPPGDRERYREAGERFRAIREDARNLTAAELLTRLWYDEGYRYETVWSASSQVYGDLYDLLFELARHIDERGGGLCDFIDYLDRLAEKQEKNDDLDQNGEGPGVRIMSIHKCKGLEFPVVFLFGCSKIERTGGASLTSYSEKWGLALDLPQAEELPLKGGNYFSLLEKEEERRKEEAELRRLLYVAMTRAESELYLTAVLKKQPEGKEKTEGPAFGGYGEAYLRERLVRLNAEDEKSGASKQKPGSLSFLRLLLPVLAGTEEPPYTIEPIPALDRNALRGLAGTGGKETAQSPLGEKTMEEAAAAAAPFYETTAPPPRTRPLPLTIPASGLHVPRLEAAGPPAEFPGPARNAPEGLEGLLKKAGLEAAEFGTLVHGFIEDRFSGREERIPPRFSARCGESLLGPLREQARVMADAFFASPLGRLALAASFRKTEYPILSAVELPAGVREGEASCGPGRVIISGKLDLIFEGGGALHVVDFKSDRTEEISRHLGQLAVYRRAVSDIFGSPLSGREEGPPVRCWLYYLRSGRERELSGELDLISPEELAAGFTGN